MNPYFLGISLYALMILPVSLRFRFRLGKRSGYLVRFQAGGLPFAGKRGPEDRREERPFREEDAIDALTQADPTLIHAVLDGRVLGRFLRALEVRELEFYAHISFPDAAATALCYCGLCTLVHTLNAAGALPPAFRWRLRADFKGEGTEALAAGIVSFRLGSLLPVAAAFAGALAHRTAPIEKEEMLHADPSH